MSNRTTMLLFLALATALIAMVGPSLTAAYAADVPSATFSLRPVHHDANQPATRAYFVLDAHPGQTIQDEVLVSNSGNARGTALLYAVDATTGDTTGVSYLDQASPRQSVGAWINLSQDRITLDPGQSKAIDFTVHVPAGARAGQHVGGIVVQDTTLHSGTQSGTLHVNVQTRTVDAVQVNLPGAVVEKVAARGIAATVQSGYQTLLLSLRNDGTQMVKPTGSLDVTDASGKVVQTAKLTLNTFLPDTAIVYPIHLQGQALGSGDYQAHLDLTYGSSGDLSVDLPFTIAAAQLKGIPTASAAAPATLPAVQSASGGNSMPVWQIVGLTTVVLIGAVLLTAAAVVLSRRRRHGHAGHSA